MKKQSGRVLCKLETLDIKIIRKIIINKNERKIEKTKFIRPS